MRFRQRNNSHDRNFSSVCSSVYNKISASVSESVIIGFFADLFSHDSDIEKNGVIHSPLNKKSVFGKLLGVRVFLAGKYENSILGGWLSNLYKSFFSLPLRTVAVFLMTFGLILTLGSSLTSNGIVLPVNSSYFFTGIAATAVSILLFPSKKSIYYHITVSKFLSLFCNDTTAALTDADNAVHRGYSSAFLAGLIFGLAAFVFTPSKVLLVLVALLCTGMIFNYPETGVLITVSFLPIISSAYIFYLVFVTFLAYLFKYLIGKRHFNTNDTDLTVFVFAVVIFASGIFTASGISGMIQSIKILFCLAVLLLISNLVRSTKTVLKCISMLIGSAFAVCIFNIFLFVFQYTRISDELSLHFSVTDFFGVLNIFSGSNELGVFSATLIPLIFSLVLNSRDARSTKYYMLLIMLYVNVIISGNSIAFWVSIISMIVVLSFRIVPLLLLIIPCTVFSGLIKATPGFILKLFGLNSLNATTADSAVNSSAFYDYVSTYGVFGTGLGNENINASLNSINTSVLRFTGFNSLFEITLISLGFFGALVAIILIACFLSKPLRYVLSDRYKDERISTSCIGLFTSCISFMLSAMFSGTAHDTRLIMLFAVCLSLSVACVRSSRNDHISECVVREHINH